MQTSLEYALYLIRRADDPSLPVKIRREMIQATNPKGSGPATLYKNWCKAKRQYYTEHGLATEAELDKWRRLKAKSVPKGQGDLFGGEG